MNQEAFGAFETRTSLVVKPEHVQFDDKLMVDHGSWGCHILKQTRTNTPECSNLNTTRINPHHCSD